MKIEVEKIQRNLEVIQILKSPTTAFLLATFPSEVRYLESVAFLQSLKKSGIPLAGILLNRVEPYCPDSSSVESLRPLLEYYHSLHRQQQHWVEKFKAAAPDLPCLVIERRAGSVHDVNTLYQLGNFLVS